MAMLVDTGTRVFQYLQWKHAIRLEMMGIKVARRSVTAHVKRLMGWKGNRESILAQLEQFIQTNYPTL